MILNKYMQNKKDISAVGGYGNLDILKILLALPIVLRHIGQWFLEYSCAVTPQVRQTGNRLSGLAGTAYASLLT